MANILEADVIRLNSAAASDSVANCDDSAEAETQTTCISGTDFLDSHLEFTGRSKSLSNCKLNSETLLVGMSVADNSVDSDSSKSCVIPSMANLSADHISDISYQTTDDLCSDRTSICDPTPVTNCVSVEPDVVSRLQTVQNCLSVENEIRKDSKIVDSSPEDCGDLSVMNDDSRFEDQEVVKEWLQGTVEHLKRITSSDENDLDIDLEIQDEETVEVQEFYQEEEIAEETIGSEEETCSSKDEDENEEPLSYELQQGYKILREIMGNNNRSFTWPFVNPVDSTAEGCADYYEKVKKPMWLMKMRGKFERREYENITEYVADMRLMFENCYRYNGLNHPISRSGSKLEMMMEQKLQLLSRINHSINRNLYSATSSSLLRGAHDPGQAEGDGNRRELREKTSLAATSGETFEMPLTSTRRQKQFPSGSMTVLHRLRYEAQEKEKEAKRQQQLDRKLAYEAMLKELDVWEDNLFKEPYRQQMKAMWELPQIGQFLFLCGKALNLAEVSQYELECCLLLPQQSSALQRIMTCILSTPHQRARLQGKSLMPYRVWEEKLRQLLILWYKTYEDAEKNAKKTVIKLGLDEKFFKVVGRTNPLEKKKFHELTFYQRVWILKSLCDNCLEVQKSLNEVIESHPLHDQRATKLGSDNDGNEYIHFPQFCGEDLRIYRQIRPVVIYEETNKEKASSSRSRLKRHHKHRHRSIMKKSLLELPEPSASSATPRIRDSRLRQNPRQVQSYQLVDSSTSSDSESTSGDQEDDEEKEEEEKEDEEKEADEEEEEEKKEKEMQLEEETPVKEEHHEVVKESEEAVLKAVRTSQKRCASDKNKTKVKSTEPESCFALYDSRHPRRSVRKILEESMKDAIRCTSPNTDKNPRRRSSMSSCSSLGLSRSGQESVYRNGLQLPGKRGTGSVEKDKRKRDFSSEEDEAYMEPVQLPITSPRLTRSRAQSKRKLNNSVNRSKTCAIGLSQKDSLRPFDVGRITRNLYKTLLQEEKEEAANGNCQHGQVSDDTEKRGRKGGRRKKRSCLTVVSSVSDCPGCEVSNCGDASTGIDNAKVGTSSEEAACNGHDVVADVSSCVESVSSGVGQGDCRKDDPEVKTEVHKKMTVEETPVPSELVSGDSTMDDEPLPPVKASSDCSMEDKPVILKPLSDRAVGEFQNTSVNGEISDSKAVDLKSVVNQKVEPEVKQDESVLLGTKEEVLEKADVKTEEKTENQVTNPENVAIEVKKEDEDEVCEILGPESGEFELVVDSIQGLRQLIEKFADKEDDDQKNEDATGNPSYRKRCTIALHERLTNLLEEVEKHEQHLLNFKKKKMIRLRKEQENYREEPEREQSVSPWPPQEETAENEARTDEGRPKRSLRQIDRQEKCIISQRSLQNKSPETESKSGEFSFQRSRRSLQQLYRRQQAEDIWENNDSTSCASNGNADATNDECSVDAESSSSKAEDKPAEVPKKPRPSRKRTAIDASLPGASPSLPTSESAPATPTSTVSTRKRPATAQVRAQSAKKAKKKNSCVVNAETAANPSSEVIAAAPDSSVGLSTPLTTKNSLIRGLINAGGVARMKQSAGAQPTANLTSDIRNQLSSTTPLASYFSQQSNRIQTRAQRPMATSNSLMARLAGSLPLATSNSSSFASRRSAGSVPQASPRVNMGQVLQPYIEQGVLRLASPSGSGMQFLAVSNISQLPPGLLQQLVSNQSLRMVASSGATQGHSAAATSTVAPSAAMSNCLFVPNNGLRPALGVTQDFRLSNNVQPRAISSQNLLSVVGQNRVSQTANQNYLPSLPLAARTTLSAESGFTVCSQPNNSSILTSAQLCLPPVKPVQCLSSISACSSVRPLFGQSAQTSVLHPLLRQNVPSSQPGVDSAVRQRYTNNLTVRALLGNRNSLEQIHNLYPGSSDETGIPPSLSNIGRLAVSAENPTAYPATGSLAASHLITDIPSEGMLSEYGCTNTQTTSAFSIVVTSIMSSSQCRSLSVPGNQRPIMHTSDMLSSSLCFKMGDISSGAQRLAQSTSKPGNPVSALATNNIAVTGSKQLQHSVQALQVMAQTSAGPKIIVLPQEAVVSGTSGIRQLLAGDRSQQTVFLTPEQVAAMAHVNRAKAVVATSISASHPLADIKIIASLAVSHTTGLGTHTTGLGTHTTGLGTHTTSVLKSPIPSLPPLTDNNILSPNKSIVRSGAALLSPASSGKALSFIPVHFSQASNVMPISVQTTSSVLPLPASVLAAATASTNVRANVPVVFNSALMMRGTQNVLVLQPAPVQVLSFDRNAPALNNTPLKISLNIPPSVPSSVSNIAPAAQLSSPCKTTRAPCVSIDSSGQLVQHQSIPHLTLPGFTLPSQVVVTQAAQNVAVPKHVVSARESVQLVLSPEQSAVNKLGQSLSIPCQVLQLPSPGNQPSPRPAVAQSAASSNLQILAAQASSSRPILPGQKCGIVIQQNIDGACLGQLPLQEIAKRVNNRFSARLVTVSPPSGSTPNAGNNDPQVLLSQTSNSKTQLQGVRLLPNSCVGSLASGSQPSALTVLPTFEKRPVNVLQTLGPATQTAAVTIIPSTQLSAGHMTPCVKKIDGVRLISGADAARILQSRARVLQQPQRQPILPVPASNLNRPTQLAVPTNISTLPLLRSQVVQLAVQPSVPVMQQGRVVEVHQPMNPSSTSQVVRILQQAQLQSLSQETQRNVSAPGVRPVTQLSRVTTQPGFFLSDPAQLQCMTTASNYMCSVSNSSMPGSNPALSNLTQSTSGFTVRPSVASFQSSNNTGMNLDLASLLQAASVVDNSANQGCDLNILNLDSMYDGQPTS